MNNKNLGYVAPLLTGLRGVLAPFLIWDAYDGYISEWFIFLFLIGVLSDMIDGEILRRLNLTRIKWELMDSVMDAIFYMSVFFCMWRINPSVIQTYLIPVVALLILQGGSWLFSLIKFGKTTGYHSHLAKLWAMTLLVGMTGFFLGEYQFFPFAVFIGILSTLEDIIITAIMPYWKTGIPHIKTAIDLREEAVAIIKSNDLP